MSLIHPHRLIWATFSLLAFAGCATAPVPQKSADVLFREGEDLYASKHYEDAIAQWKKVKESFSSPELTASAELKIADAQFDNESYIEAAASYEDFRKFHPKHEKAAYALFRLAMCNFKQMGGIDTDQTSVKNAVNLFESFLQQYPQDERSAEVRQKLQECRARQMKYEVYVGRFYLRTDKYQAAIKRLTDALGQFPGLPDSDEALFYLGQAYIRSGDKEKGRETFNRILKEFPSSAYIGDARKFMDKYY
jgi:outer membrane protein assembly factor BamD